MTTTLRKTPSQRLHKHVSASEDELSPKSVASAASNDSDENDNHTDSKHSINSDHENDNEKENSITSPSSRSMTSSPGVGLPCSVEAKTRVERLSDKIHALLWVSIAATVGWYLDLPHTLLVDSRIHRTLFNIATVLLMINFVLISYLGIYLPKVIGIKDSSAWESYCPRVIPIMTFNGILMSLLAIRSLWPVFGFLTPFILGLEFFGVVFGLNFIPWV